MPEPSALTSQRPSFIRAVREPGGVDGKCLHPRWIKHDESLIKATNEPEAITGPEAVGANPSAFSPSKDSLSKEMGPDQRTGEDLPRNDSDSSEASRLPGRWRSSIPRSWKKKKSATPRVDVEEYSYDAKNDIHSFNPVYNGVIEEVVDSSVKSTLVVRTENGITTVPIYTPPEEFESTF